MASDRPISFWPVVKTKEQLELERERLRTVPHRDADPRTQFVRGGEATVVELISGPDNPYRDMFIHAHQTWGAPGESKADLWTEVSPRERMESIYHILTFQSLPLALEIPKFYFEVRNCVRYVFDQIVRTRIGVTYSSEGTRDNDVADIPVMVPPRIYDDQHSSKMFARSVIQAKQSYADLVTNGIPWADARALIPQGIMHRFAWSIDYLTLMNFEGKRMRFCMDLGIVDVAWKARRAIASRYAVLAIPLRPECDRARKCTYRAEGRPGEAYSNLFAGCGRWPDPNPVAEFNVSSANPEDEAGWLGERDPLLFDGAYSPDWEAAFKKDERYFQ